MRCADCKACHKSQITIYPAGKGEPYILTKYMCYGVKEPFEITNIERECTEYPEKSKIIKDDDWFLNEIKEEDGCFEILNWYRNLYHTEPDTTERGVVARAINELFIKMGKDDINA